ncbi:1972_t:CDS:1 [Paraglomus brasilianum]|uniref:1972_t:CDS:1 n=1 Tax=Paraglomus brasilianum TaxID=144538 RepID=A0A9N9H0X2_9GLOM|nr:1972_t:CDS:1 [Paraglomus brasilianum]
MSFNPDSIDLEILFDTKEKAEQFIKKFAEGFRQDLSSFPSSFTNARLINSSNPRKQYLGLKEIYQRVIIPNVENKIRSRLRKKNPGLSDAQFNLLLGREKEKDLELSRKNLEYTRLSGAFNVLKTGETESNLPSGFGLGKATCGTCHKEKRNEEPTLGPKEAKNNKAG